MKVHYPRLGIKRTSRVVAHLRLRSIFASQGYRRDAWDDLNSYGEYHTRRALRSDR